MTYSTNTECLEHFTLSTARLRVWETLSLCCEALVHCSEVIEVALEREINYVFPSLSLSLSLSLGLSVHPLLHRGEWLDELLAVVQHISRMECILN